MTNLPDAFEIPEATHELAMWLEERLCGEGFFEVVEALSAVRSVADQGNQTKADGAVSPISDEKLAMVLAKGLLCLSRPEINALLARPKAIYSLQEEVFKNGGEYWGQYFDKANGSSTLPSLDEKEPLSRPETSADVRLPADETTALDTKKRRSLLPAALSTLAASVLVFAGGFWLGQNQTRSPIAQGQGTDVIETPPANSVATTEKQSWGWNRDNVLAIELDRSNKLNHIANLLSEWNAVEPESAPELLARAKELRQSCDVLLESKFTDLPEDDIDWLKEKCRTWATKFDTQITRLSAPENFESVRNELNRLVRKSIFLIRAKARDV